MKKEVLCFDIDGTLLKNNRAMVEALNQAFEKNNLLKVSSARIISLLGKTGLEIIHILYPQLTKRKIEAIVEEYSEILPQKMHLAQPIPGVNEALMELKKHYKLAVISNATHQNMVTMLENGGIDDPKIFNAIVGGDDVANAKPNPDSIKKVEKVLNSKVAYMIGDTIYDIKAGKAAGVKTVGVLTGVHSIEELGKEKPTIIIQSIAILPDVLLGNL